MLNLNAQSLPERPAERPATNGVTVVDYGLANLQSVINAFEYLGAAVTLASDGQALEGAEKIVLPGVGSFAAGMRGLRERGLAPVLEELVLRQRRPYFGICLGMQFLLEGSAEGDEPGLGWVAGQVARFPDGPGCEKVPHIGWNNVQVPSEGKLFAGIEDATDFYFVHSYFVPETRSDAYGQVGICDYGLPFIAAFERDNLFACQFHPEKSQLAGMKMIQNFLAV